MWTINSLCRALGLAVSKRSPRHRRPARRRPEGIRLWLLNLEDRSLPSVVMWNSAVAPNGGSWTTPADWSTGSVPDAADDVQITGLNSGAVITYSSTSPTSIRSLTTNLTGGGTLNFTISRGELDVELTATLDGNTTVNLAGGTLGGPANWTLNGPLNWTSGNITREQTFTVNGGMTLSGTTHELYAGTLIVPATAAATWSGGDIVLGYGEVLDNNGTFNAQTNATISSTTGGGVINNAGTFQLSNSTTTTTINPRFNNSGTVSVQSGTLDLGGGGNSSNAQFNVTAPATLEFAGTSSIDANSSISGSGNVLFAGNTSNFEMAGSYAITGSTRMAGGSAGFPGSVASVGDTLTISQGSIDFGNNSVAATTGTFSGGALYGLGDVNLTNLDWTGTAMAEAGSTTVTGLLNIHGNTTKDLISRTLNINPGASAFWEDSGSISLQNDATINNSGTFTVQTNVALAASGGVSAFFNNLGSFIQSQQTNVTTINTVFNNAGMVDVQTGTLVLASGGQSSGSFEIDAPPPPTPPAVLVFGGGTHLLTPDSSIFGDGGVVFSGSNTTTVVAGSYAINGSTQISGGYADFPGSVASVGSSLTISGGTADFEMNTINADTGTFSGGTLQGLGDVSFNVSLNWNGRGTTMAEPGSTTILPGALLTITGTYYKYLAGRTLNIDEGATAVWTATTYNIQLSDAAVINNAGEFDIQVGNAINGSDLEAFNNVANADGTSGSLVKEQSASPTTFNPPFNNSGSVQVSTGQLTFAGGGATSGAASFNTDPGTTLAFGGVEQWINAGATVTGAGTTVFQSGASFILGTYDVSGPTSVTGSSTAVYFFTPASSGAFTNSAATVVLSPSDPTTGLTVTGDYTQTGNSSQGATYLYGATLSANNVNLQGGSFFAQGTVTTAMNGNFTNAGILHLGVPGTPGSLQVNGNYVQTSAGTLDIQVGGSDPGVDYDQLTVSGTATLSGALNVSLIDGYVPPSGSSYQIMIFQSETGTFTGGSIDRHFGNPPVYDLGDVTLEAN